MNAEIWTIIGVAIAMIGIIYLFLRNFKDDIKELEKKIDGMNIRINEIDKRLYGIETVLHMKDCCVLKQDQNLKKAD